MKVFLLEHLPVDPDASSLAKLDGAAVELLVDLFVFIHVARERKRESGSGKGEKIRKDKK